MLGSDFVGVFRGRGIQPFKSKVGQLHVMSGSYNPLHEAHRWMFDNIDEEAFAVQRYAGGGRAVVATTSAKYFEISTARVGKEDLSIEEVQKRLTQFAGYAPVLVTSQAYFTDKYAVLRPFADDVIFHIGYDNYERLIQINGLGGVSHMGCRFCVWPRDGAEFTKGPPNCFPSGVILPDHLVGMSSTKIRAERAAKEGT